MADGPNKVPPGLVCPRCGSPTTGTEYCGTCGLHLTEQDELPTRERWEQLRVDEADRTPDPLVMSTTSWSERWSGLARNTRAGIALGVVAFVLLVVFVAAMSTGDSGGDRSDVASDPPPSAPEPLPEERCVDLWNGAEDFSGKSFASTFAERGEVIATVGFSRDFPDRCQIVVAAPDVGTGVVQVHRESTDEARGPFQLITGGSVATLPENAKRWNARLSADGTITLGYP